MHFSIDAALIHYKGTLVASALQDKLHLYCLTISASNYIVQNDCSKIIILYLCKMIRRQHDSDL